MAFRKGGPSPNVLSPVLQVLITRAWPAAGTSAFLVNRRVMLFAMSNATAVLFHEKRTSVKLVQGCEPAASMVVKLVTMSGDGHSPLIRVATCASEGLSAFMKSISAPSERLKFTPNDRTVPPLFCPAGFMAASNKPYWMSLLVLWRWAPTTRCSSSAASSTISSACTELPLSVVFVIRALSAFAPILNSEFQPCSFLWLKSWATKAAGSMLSVSLKYSTMLSV